MPLPSIKRCSPSRRQLRRGVRRSSGASLTFLSDCRGRSLHLSADRRPKTWRLQKSWRLATAHAEVALAAEHVRQHRAAIADPDGGDVRTDLEDVGRELVAEDLRQVLVRDEPPPALVLVQV